MKTVITVTASGFAVLGAVLWFLSARVRVPARITAQAYITHPESPHSWDGPIQGLVFSEDLQELIEALQEQGRLNKWAAVCTGIAVATQALAMAFED